MNIRNIHNLKLQYNEIEQVKWASKDEILEMFDKKEFVPHDIDIIEKYLQVNSAIDAVK